MKTLLCTLIVVTLLLLLTGCSDNLNSTAPADENGVAPLHASALAKGAWVEMVTGSGHARMNGMNLVTITVTAQKDAADECKGEFQGYDRNIDLKVHLKVYHMDVEGNQAFVVLYGMLPETIWYGPPKLGYGMILITDNGQGNKAELPDQHSWIAFWPDNGPPPWPFVTNNLAHATVSQAKAFLTTPNPNGFGWPDAMLYVPIEMGNFEVQSR